MAEIKIALLNFAHEDRTREIAARLALPILDAREEGYQYFLYFQEDAFTVEALVEGGFTELNVNFGQRRILDRLLAGDRSEDPFLRAMGKGIDPKGVTVFDATLGFAVDSLHLAQFGFTVTGSERNPVIRELTKDGLRRAQNVPELAAALANFNLVEGNAIDILSDLSEHDRPEIVYMDPMYPEMKRSVKRKKALEFLRDLVGDDLDARELFQRAWSSAKRRVVVKRPLKGEQLGGEPNHVLRGKSHRFDVYVKS